MKSIKMIFMALCMALCMVSCGGSQLEMAADAINATCPIKMSDAMSMTSVTVENGNLVYTIEFDEDQIPVEDLKGMQDQLLESYKESVGADESLVNMMKEFNAHLIYRHVGNKSGEGVEINLNAE